MLVICCHRNEGAKPLESGRAWLSALGVLLTVGFFLILSPRSLPAQQPPSHPRPAARAPQEDPQLQQAASLLQQGRLDEAKLSAQEVLAKDAKNVEALNLLGISALRSGILTVQILPCR